MFTLVLYIYADMLTKGDSVALTNIEGFTSYAVCVQAGKDADKLVGGSTKEVRFVCVKK